MRLTGLAPLVVVATLITPGTGSLSAVGVAPANDRAIVTTAGSLTATGVSPTAEVYDPHTITPSTGELWIGEVNPNQTRTPTTGSLGLTGIAPTVDAQTSQDYPITPTVGSLSLAGAAPSLDLGVTPPVGHVGEAITNLCLQSQNHDDTNYWSHGFLNATGMADVTTAPDGTTTAEQVIGDNTNNYHSLHQYFNSLADNTDYCYSIYVKAKTGIDWVALMFIDKTNTAPRFYFNLSTGQIGTISPVPDGYGAIPVGNGWYRLWIRENTASGAQIPYMFLALADQDGNYVFTGDNIGGVYTWGAQLEMGTFPTPYFATGTSAVTNYAIKGYPPTVRQASYITPSAGSLSVDGVAPTTKVGALCSPQAGSLTLQGVAPAVGSDIWITPSAGSLTLAGVTPTLQVPVELTPSAGALTLAGVAPTVGGSGQITPSAGSLSVSGVAPTVIQQTRITPSAGALTAAGVAGWIPASSCTFGYDPPSRQVSNGPTWQNVTLTASAIGGNENYLYQFWFWDDASPGWNMVQDYSADNTYVWDLSGQTVCGVFYYTVYVKTVGSSVDPEAYANASYILDVGCYPTVGSLSVTGQQITQGIAVTPSVGALTIAGVAPTVNAPSIITPSTGSLGVTGQGITQGITVTPTVGSIAASGVAPSPRQANFVTPAVGALTLTGKVSTFSWTDHHYITPPVGRITINGTTVDPRGWAISGKPTDSWSLVTAPSDSWSLVTAPSDSWTLVGKPS